MFELALGIVVGFIAALALGAYLNGRFKDGIQLDDFKPR